MCTHELGTDLSCCCAHETEHDPLSTFPFVFLWDLDSWPVLANWGAPAACRKVNHLQALQKSLKTLILTSPKQLQAIWKWTTVWGPTLENHQYKVTIHKQQAWNLQKSETLYLKLTRLLTSSRSVQHRKEETTQTQAPFFPLKLGSSWISQLIWSAFLGCLTQTTYFTDFQMQRNEHTWQVVCTVCRRICMMYVKRYDFGGQNGDDELLCMASYVVLCIPQRWDIWWTESCKQGMQASWL